MSKKLLVIEDDQSMRWVLEKSLTKEGYGVTSRAAARPDRPSGAVVTLYPSLVSDFSSTHRML